MVQHNIIHEWQMRRSAQQDASQKESGENANEELAQEIKHVQEELEIVKRQRAGGPRPETEDLSNGWTARALLKQADVEPNMASIYGIPNQHCADEIVHGLLNQGRWSLYLNFGNPQDVNAANLIKDIEKIYENTDPNLLWYWHDRKYEAARQRANVEYCARIRHLQQCRKDNKELTPLSYYEIATSQQGIEEIRRLVAAYNDLPYKLSFVFLRSIHSTFRPLVIMDSAQVPYSRLQDKIFANQELEDVALRPGPHEAQGMLGPLKEILLNAPMLFLGDANLKPFRLWDIKPVGYKVPHFRIELLRPFGYHLPRYLDYKSELSPVDFPSCKK